MSKNFNCEDCLYKNICGGYNMDEDMCEEFMCEEFMCEEDYIEKERESFRAEWFNYLDRDND